MQVLNPDQTIHACMGCSLARPASLALRVWPCETTWDGGLTTDLISMALVRKCNQPGSGFRSNPHVNGAYDNVHAHADNVTCSHTFVIRLFCNAQDLWCMYVAVHKMCME